MGKHMVLQSVYLNLLALEAVHFMHLRPEEGSVDNYAGIGAYRDHVSKDLVNGLTSASRMWASPKTFGRANLALLKSLEAMVSICLLKRTRCVESLVMSAHTSACGLGTTRNRFFAPRYAIRHKTTIKAENSPYSVTILE